MKKSVIFGVLATLILLVLALYLNNDERKTGSKKAYGTIDIEESSLSFELPGKIEKILTDEGEFKPKGKILAELKTDDLKLEIEAKKQSCKALEANYNKLKEGYQKEDVKIALANAKSLQNSVKLSNLTLERVERLYKKNATSKQHFDEVYFGNAELKNKLAAAMQKYNKLKNGYELEDIKASEAKFKACKAQLEILNYNLKEKSVIKAPFSGVVRSKLKEIGDYVSPINPVFEFANTKHKKARIYLSEDQMKFAKLGKEVKIYGANNSLATGKIAFISPSATFTPRTVQTEALRADLVWEIRVDFDDEKGEFWLGEPISVEIL